MIETIAEEITEALEMPNKLPLVTIVLEALWDQDNYFLAREMCHNLDIASSKYGVRILKILITHRPNSQS